MKIISIKSSILPRLDSLSRLSRPTSNQNFRFHKFFKCTVSTPNKKITRPNIRCDEEQQAYNENIIRIMGLFSDLMSTVDKGKGKKERLTTKLTLQDELLRLIENNATSDTILDFLKNWSYMSTINKREVEHLSNEILSSLISIVRRADFLKLFKLLISCNVEFSDNDNNNFTEFDTMISYILRHGSIEECEVISNPSLANKAEVIINQYSIKMIESIMNYYSRSKNISRYNEFSNYLNEKSYALQSSVGPLNLLKLLETEIPYNPESLSGVLKHLENCLNDNTILNGNIAADIPSNELVSFHLENARKLRTVWHISNHILITYFLYFLPNFVTMFEHLGILSLYNINEIQMANETLKPLVSQNTNDSRILDFAIEIISNDKTISNNGLLQLLNNVVEFCRREDPFNGMIGKMLRSINKRFSLEEIDLSVMSQIYDNLLKNDLKTDLLPFEISLFKILNSSQSTSYERVVQFLKESKPPEIIELHEFLIDTMFSVVDTSMHSKFLMELLSSNIKLKERKLVSSLLLNDRFCKSIWDVESINKKENVSFLVKQLDKEYLTLFITQLLSDGNEVTNHEQLSIILSLLWSNLEHGNYKNIDDYFQKVLLIVSISTENSIKPSSIFDISDFITVLADILVKAKISSLTENDKRSIHFYAIQKLKHLSNGNINYLLQYLIIFFPQVLNLSSLRVQTLFEMHSIHDTKSKNSFNRQSLPAITLIDDLVMKDESPNSEILSLVDLSFISYKNRKQLSVAIIRVIQNALKFQNDSNLSALNVIQFLQENIKYVNWQRTRLYDVIQKSKLKYDTMEYNLYISTSYDEMMRVLGDGCNNKELQRLNRCVVSHISKFISREQFPNLFTSLLDNNFIIPNTSEFDQFAVEVLRFADEKCKEMISLGTSYGGEYNTQEKRFARLVKQYPKDLLLRIINYRLRERNRDETQFLLKVWETRYELEKEGKAKADDLVILNRLKLHSDIRFEAIFKSKNSQNVPKTIQGLVDELEYKLETDYVLTNSAIPAVSINHLHGYNLERMSNNGVEFKLLLEYILIYYPSFEEVLNKLKIKEVVFNNEEAIFFEKPKIKFTSLISEKTTASYITRLVYNGAFRLDLTNEQYLKLMQEFIIVYNRYYRKLPGLFNEKNLEMVIFRAFKEIKYNPTIYFQLYSLIFKNDENLQYHKTDELKSMVLDKIMFGLIKNDLRLAVEKYKGLKSQKLFQITPNTYSFFIKNLRNHQYYKDARLVYNSMIEHYPELKKRAQYR